MADEKESSASVTGSPIHSINDIVDTSWDIPPLSFPSLPSLPEEAASSKGSEEESGMRKVSSDVPASPVVADGALDDAPSMISQALSAEYLVDAKEKPASGADIHADETLPLFASTKPSQDAASTQVLKLSNIPETDSSDGIEDLEQLAQMDPEHDPLKAVAEEPKKKPARSVAVNRNAIIAVVAFLVAALAVVVVFMVRDNIESNDRRVAISTCEQAESKYSKASQSLQKAVDNAAEMQKLDAKQVADAKTLDHLNQAVTKATNLKNVGNCEATQSSTVLRANARAMSKQLDDIKQQTSTVESATAKVKTSKTTLEVNNARTALQEAISTAQTLLDNSLGSVADESTRATLSQAITSAQKLIDGKSTDIKAMQDAVNTLNTSSDAVDQSIAEEEAAEAAAAESANAQSNTNGYGNGYGNNGTNGTNSYRNGYYGQYQYRRTDGSGTGNKNSGASDDKEPDADSGSDASSDTPSNPYSDSGSQESSTSNKGDSGTSDSNSNNTDQKK